MELNDRVQAFVHLGEFIRSLSDADHRDLADRAIQENPWFTAASVGLALTGIERFLHRDDLIAWANQYPIANQKACIVGVVMAGNIPMVGFHDFLCVLIAGHRLKAKLSGQDSVLLSHLHQQLIDVEPRFNGVIEFADRMNGIDAVIATGSDNTARYFEYYFRNIPHLIRKNRTSIAVLTGNESESERRALADDIFCYFGLGCRNVSKLFVPRGYEFGQLLGDWNHHSNVIHHHKYANNYDYQKSILLVNRTPFLDTGFVLLKEDTSTVSPIAVLYFAYYDDASDLQEQIARDQDKIQCIVSHTAIPFGQAQFPGLSDYADNVDTLSFLSGLGR